MGVGMIEKDAVKFTRDQVRELKRLALEKKLKGADVLNFMVGLLRQQGPRVLRRERAPWMGEGVDFVPAAI